MNTTSNQESEVRYWYTVFSNLTSEFVCGWCFGRTPEEALASAVKDVRRTQPTRKKGNVFLQSDREPWARVPVEQDYHSFKDVDFVGGVK